MARSSTSYRPKWKLGNTTVVRVPQALVSDVLRFAHELDEKANPIEFRDGAIAYRTAEDVEINKPVNAAFLGLRDCFFSVSWPSHLT